MTDSKRSEEEVHVLDSQIIRIGQATSKCHENHKYLIEPIGKIKYNE